MATLAITVADDASAADRETAAEVGPDFVGASAPLPDMVRAAGFEVVARLDWTAAFEETGAGILRARADFEDELRHIEGDETYEEEVRKRQAVLHGIRSGLLRRTLVIAAAGTAEHGRPARR